MIRIPRLRIGFSDFILCYSVVFLAIFHYPNFANDPGLGWHLKSGEIIRNTLSLPRVDSLLAAPNLLPWVPDQWLGSTILSFLYDYGGWPLLYVVLTTVYCLTFFVVLHKLGVKTCGSVLATSVAAFLAWKLGTVQFVLRPLIFSFLFFGLVFSEMYVFYYRIKTGIQQIPKSFYFLPVLFFIWATIHPYYILGLILGGMLLLGVLCDMVVLKSYAKNNHILLVIFFVMLTSGLATSLTPYGLGLHSRVLGLGTSDFYTNFLQEWKSIDFKSTEGKFLQISFVLLLIGFAFPKDMNWRWGCFEIFYVLGFSHFSLGAVRGLPLLGIVTMPLFAQAFLGIGRWEWFYKFSIMRKFFWFISKVENWEKKTGRGYVSLGVVSIIALGYVLRFSEVPFYKASLGPSKNKFPYAQVDFLLKKSSSVPVVVANELNWGGFLAWKGYPKLKPIIDDRLTIREESFYKKYLKELKVGGDWKEYLKSQEANYLLLESDNPLAIYLIDTKLIPVVYKDEVGVLFEVM